MGRSEGNGAQAGSHEGVESAGVVWGGVIGRDRIADECLAHGADEDGSHHLGVVVLDASVREAVDEDVVEQRPIAGAIGESFRLDRRTGRFGEQRVREPATLQRTISEDPKGYLESGGWRSFGRSRIGDHLQFASCRATERRGKQGVLVLEVAVHGAGRDLGIASDPGDADRRPAGGGESSDGSVDDPVPGRLEPGLYLGRPAVGHTRNEP